jgi:palmitoyltransferase
MDLISFIYLYFGVTVLFIFVLLFGENLIFQGTPVAWLHWLLTQGIWDGFA